MSDDSFSWLQNGHVYVGRRQKGFGITELLDLPETLRELMIEITKREPVSLADLIESLDRNPIELEVQISQLIAQGWLDVEEDELGEWVYRVRIAHGGKRILPPGIWEVLNDRWQMPVYRLFPDAIREEFSRCFQLERHKPGIILFEAGTWSERMYVVGSGKVELLVHNQAGETFVVQEVGTGEILGEMAVLLGERRPYTARVVEGAQLWTLTKADLDRLLTRYPAIGLTIRRELTRHMRLPSKITSAKDQYNPVVVVGEGSGELARHLAEQVDDQVVLIDLVGRRLDAQPNLVYIDGRGLHSKAIAQTINEKIGSNAWVVVASLPGMTDLLMRVAGLAEVVIDIPESDATWLRATARQYWAVPFSTPVQMARLARKLCGRVTGVVLSGGAARTIAHLGVLDVLHKAGTPIDVIASCGYGALWGVLYAAGWSPDQMIDLATSQARKLQPFTSRFVRRFSPRATSQAGLFDARSVRSWIQSVLGERTFSDLETRCYLAASDLITGEAVSIKDGRLSSALSACVATPGLVTPVEYGDRLLVDGILSNPLPVNAMMAERVDVILASTVIPMPGMRREKAQSSDSARDLVTTWLGICDTVAHERSLDHLDFVDLIITPDVGEFADTAFEQALILIERGRQAAQKALPRIRSLL